MSSGIPGLPRSPSQGLPEPPLMSLAECEIKPFHTHVPSLEMLKQGDPGWFGRLKATPSLSLHQAALARATAAVYWKSHNPSGIPEYTKALSQFEELLWGRLIANLKAQGAQGSFPEQLASMNLEKFVTGILADLDRSPELQKGVAVENKMRLAYDLCERLWKRYETEMENFPWIEPEKLADVVTQKAAVMVYQKMGINCALLKYWNGNYSRQAAHKRPLTRCEVNDALGFNALPGSGGGSLTLDQRLQLLQSSRACKQVACFFQKESTQIAIRERSESPLVKKAEDLKSHIESLEARVKKLEKYTTDKYSFSGESAENLRAIDPFDYSSVITKFNKLKKLEQLTPEKEHAYSKQAVQGRIAELKAEIQRESNAATSLAVEWQERIQHDIDAYCHLDAQAGMGKRIAVEQIDSPSRRGPLLHSSFIESEEEEKSNS